jgi:hypothetical protein
MSAARIEGQTAIVEMTVDIQPDVAKGRIQVIAMQWQECANSGHSYGGLANERVRPVAAL